MRITVKGLADFMTGSAAKQRKVVRDFKYPDPEGRARAVYYSDARRAVMRFHAAANDMGVLAGTAARLSRRSAEARGHTRQRLGDNASAIVAYASHFAERAYEILGSPRLRLEYGPVVVAVTPDLYVQERRREKILKVEFTKPVPSDRMVKIITQAMFEAVEQAGMGLGPSNVLYVDVRRGLIHKGARIRARLARDIEAACETIADIWPSL